MQHESRLLSAVFQHGFVHCHPAMLPTHLRPEHLAGLRPGEFLQTHVWCRRPSVDSRRAFLFLVQADHYLQAWLYYVEDEKRELIVHSHENWTSVLSFLEQLVSPPLSSCQATLERVNEYIRTACDTWKLPMEPIMAKWHAWVAEAPHISTRDRCLTPTSEWLTELLVHLQNWLPNYFLLPVSQLEMTILDVEVHKGLRMRARDALQIRNRLFVQMEFGIRHEALRQYVHALHDHAQVSRSLVRPSSSSSQRALHLVPTHFAQAWQVYLGRKGAHLLVEPQYEGKGFASLAPEVSRAGKRPLLFTRLLERYRPFRAKAPRLPALWEWRSPHLYTLALQVWDDAIDPWPRLFVGRRPHWPFTEQTQGRFRLHARLSEPSGTQQQHQGVYIAQMDLPPPASQWEGRIAQVTWDSTQETYLPVMPPYSPAVVDTLDTCEQVWSLWSDAFHIASLVHSLSPSTSAVQ